MVCLFIVLYKMDSIQAKFKKKFKRQRTALWKTRLINKINEDLIFLIFFMNIPYLTNGHWTFSCCTCYEIYIVKYVLHNVHCFVYSVNNINNTVL